MKPLPVNIVERTKTYNKDHCWQYDIRLNNLETDIKESGISSSQLKNMRVTDFIFRPLETKEERNIAIDFIKSHEWLGSLSQYTTHWFGAFYHDANQGMVGKDIMSGVILMNLPNAFSKLLGENTKDIERLISRGACISWSPKNLASNFAMWCIRWMTKNTQYRLFTSYSDPTANELGTIYQSCNFYYLGQKSGTTTRYVNPYTDKIVSDRFFRQRSAYKKYAKELNITWEDTWCSSTGIIWKNIPDGVEDTLRAYSKTKQSESKKIEFPPKHKYAYILGKTKAETKKLRKEFEERNKVYSYPKTRGK
jgi:hypothetical protein